MNKAVAKCNLGVKKLPGDWAYVVFRLPNGLSDKAEYQAGAEFTVVYVSPQGALNLRDADDDKVFVKPGDVQCFELS